MDEKEKEDIIQILSGFDFIEDVIANKENIYSLVDLEVVFNCSRRELLRNVEIAKFKISTMFNRRIILLYDQIGDIIAEDDIPMCIDFYIDKPRY